MGKDFSAVIQYEGSKHKQPVVVPGFFSSNDAILQEFRTQKIRQVPWVWMTSRAYASKTDSIKELVIFLFRDLMAAISLVNEDRFLELIL